MSQDLRGEAAPHGGVDASNRMAKSYLPGHMGVVFTLFRCTQMVLYPR